MGRIVVGTSSWADPGFVEEWYPRGLAAGDQLPYYAERFDAVEVNSTFYAVPEQRAVERWAAVTPARFTFDVKLHGALSRHSVDPGMLPPALRHLAEVTPRGRVRLTAQLEAALADTTLDSVAPLVTARKLSSFLLQLSPAFKPGAHALDELAPLLARLAPHRVAVELRHRGWVEGERLEATLEWMEEHRAAFVCVDAPQGSRSPTLMPDLDAVTRDDLAYLRAHGRNLEGYLRGRSVAERFGYDYTREELQEIAGRVERLAEEAQEVRVMFNNNRGAGAPQAAEQMREILGQAGART
jgi:uncharacterized protein YecE (DUF72 family)